jgi:diadenosine tetraphosphate (Ap4A) HIT family hydrolase
MANPPPSMTDCPFCKRIASAPSLQQGSAVVAIPDGFPLNPGHTLVVPRRHVADLFALSPEDQAEVWRLVAAVRERLLAERRPDGFNIGLNAGEAGGQTVAHAHVHVIPRFLGDVADPRGGVRWVIPARAAYWRKAP